MKTSYFTFATYDKNDNLLNTYFGTVDTHRIKEVAEKLLKRSENAESIRFFLKDNTTNFSTFKRLDFKRHFILTTLVHITREV